MLAEFTTNRTIVSHVFNELKDVIGDKDGISVEDVDWDFHFARDVFIEIREDDQQLLGIVAFYQVNASGTVWSPHMNMLPGKRGQKAEWAWKTSIQMLKQAKPEATTLRGSVPKQYPNVMAFVERMGCRLVRKNEHESIYELELN